MPYTDLRKTFIAVCQRAFMVGLQLSNCGNISVKIAPDRYLVNPSGVSLFELTEASLLLTDRAGRVLEGQGRPTEAFRAHRVLYETRAEVRAVAHYHPPHATAFAVQGQPIPLLTVHARRILKSLPVVAEAGEGSDELCGFLRTTFAAEQVRGAVLSGHGIIAVGRDLTEAHNLAELIDECARIALMRQLLQKI